MDELNQQDLKVAHWLNTNRPLLQKMLYFFILGVTVIIWLGVIINFVIYLKDYRVSQEALNVSSHAHGIFNVLAVPKPIKIISENSVSAGEDIYDAYAVIENNNPLFYGTFSYSVNTTESQVEFDDGFIMPNQSRYLVVKRVSTNGKKVTPDFKITNVKWHRLQSKLPTINFEISDLQFGRTGVVSSETPTEPDSKTGTTEVDASDDEASSTGGLITPDDTEEPKESTDDDSDYYTPDDIETGENDTITPTITLSNIKAKIFNNSILGFRNSVITVAIVDDSDNVVGVHKQIIKDFDSFAEQTISLSWGKKFLINTSANIEIYTHYLDKDNLIYPGD